MENDINSVSAPEPKHNLSVKIWLPVLVIFSFVVVYLALGSVYSWWPFEEQNQESFDEAQDRSGIMNQEHPSTSSGDNEFEGWQTYRNEEYGFEVKYPNDWVINERISFQKGFFISSPDNSFVAILPNGEFDHGFEESPEPTVNNIQFAGVNAELTEWPDARIIRMQDEIANWSLNDSRIETIYHSKDREVIDQILPTFKFIE